MSLEPSRVAEVTVTRTAAQPARCSGYLVATGYVLTVEHGLREAVSVGLRLDADQEDEWTAAAEVAWSDPGLDIAVLRVVESSVVPPGAMPVVEPVRFGSMTQPRAECEALGFPLFKLRDDPDHPLADGRASQYREYCYAYGSGSQWSGRRGGTIGLRVDPPAGHPDPTRSPWEGMSGAAVFSGGYLIGVVFTHHLSEGLGTLTASPIDQWYRKLSPNRMAELTALIGLPASPSELIAGDNPFPPEVLAEAARSYLAWVVQMHERLTVTGLAKSRGAMKIDLERVYVGLKVDYSSADEREAARDNLWRELYGERSARDLAAEENPSRWQLASDLPVADYFGVPAGLKRYQADGDEVLTIGQLYRRDREAVILGDPGSGKTTIMRWLALLHAKALIAGDTVVSVPGALMDVSAGDEPFVLGTPLLPILVGIGDYAADCQHCPPGQRRTLLEFLGHHSWDKRRPLWRDDVAGYGKGMPIPPEILAQLFGAALREHRALVLLDGLDQVPAAERVPMADAVTEFINTWVRDVPSVSVSVSVSNKLITTSRIAGYQLAPLPADLTQVTIEAMTDPALEVFVHHRLAEVLAELARQRNAPADPQAAEQAAQELLGLLGLPENHYVRGLATNPLLAGVIVSVFLNQGNTLPSQRVEVYQSAVQTLAKVWSLRLSGTYSEEHYHAILDALPAVAAHIHETKPNGVIRSPEFRSRLLAEVARIEGTDPEPPSPKLRAAVDSLLKIMAVELGLLVESGPEAFRFAHQSFQEFLAARHLIADSAQRASRVLEHLGDPRWREPILMAIGLMNLEHQEEMADLVKNLLAQDGPLAQLFPETALLLAAAVPQMTNVPAQVVQRTARQLLTSYSLLSRNQRLPRVRELLETALATLRTGEHAGHVDAVLITALDQSADGDPALPCAAARLIRSLDATSPALGVALMNAAPRWDRHELGSPITETLGLMVSPATFPQDGTPQSRLAPAWGTGILAMRETLRAEPDLVDQIRRSPRWLSLMLTVYGGCWNLGATAALDEFERRSGYLRLEDTSRSEFAAYFAPRWGREDPDLEMAKYHKTEGEEITRRFAAPPQFDAAAITRDSPLTRQIVRALRDDDLAALTRSLHTSLSADDTMHSADALLALWALGHPASAALANRSPATELAARRIAALIPGLADAAVRAAPHAATALARTAANLTAENWELLAAALTKVLHMVGARPISLFAELDDMPERHRARVLTEEIAQRIGGWAEDPGYDAKNFADAATQYPGPMMLAALNAQGSAWNNGYRRYAHWWPSDPLAFPYRGEADIPLAVLDQLVNLPTEMGAILGWQVGHLFQLLFAENPDVAVEVSVILWARFWGQDKDALLAYITYLDDHLAEVPQRVDHLYEVACAVEDPWHRGRALLRIAELFPAGRRAALREAKQCIGEVSDSVQAFQLRERLALLGPAQDRTRHVSACRNLASSIADPAAGARALLRLTRFVPAEALDDLAIAALDRIRLIGSRAEQLELLRLSREMFPDRPACQAAIEGLLAGIATSDQESAHVLGRWGTAIAAHLPTLCGGNETLVQAFVPVALYARATNLVRASQQDQVAEVWRALAAEPSPGTVRRVLEVQTEPVIQCTGPVARSIAAALALAGSKCLSPLLSRLVRMDYDAEPTVRCWLAHPAAAVRQIAALLLAERAGLSAETATPITELLLAEDDLLRARARNCVLPGGPGGVCVSVTGMGATAVAQLAQFAHDQNWSAPGAALVFTWHCQRLLHDDPEALSAWCDAVEQDDESGPVASWIISGIHWATTPVWTLMLDRLRHASPPLQRLILIACAHMLYQSTDSDGDFTTSAGKLQIGWKRWATLHSTLRAIDPEPLRAVRVLPVQIADVFAAAGDALAATDGTLDRDSGLRASRALWDEVGTTLGAILAMSDEAQLRSALHRLGASYIAEFNHTALAISVFQTYRRRPRQSNWPWTGLLTMWARDLLARAPQDDCGSTECSCVLEALAAAAQTNPDTFRQHADKADDTINHLDKETLSRLLAQAGLHHNSFPGRAAAADLLGVLRHGSPIVLQALRQMLRDTAPTVRQAALEAITRLRSVDSSLIDDLVSALVGPSVTTAWAAAQLLGEIGENTVTPKRVRQTIITALAQAVQDPTSRRTVHFAFVDAAIPDMPELDDVCTETLRRVYRLG